jgi:16S rRNA processing protein RimM
MTNNDENEDITELISVAKIIDAHGIKGEVKLKSFTQSQLDLFDFKELLDSSGVSKYKLKKKSITAKHIIASIAGITNRNQAELLIGTSFYVKRLSLPKIEDEQEFYYNDLIGMDILNQQKQKIAVVRAIYNFGAGDLIEIEHPNGNLEILPFSNKVVPEINISKKYLIIDFPEMI